MNHNDFFYMIVAFILLLEKLFSNKTFMYFRESQLTEIKRKKNIFPLIAILILIIIIINSISKGSINYSLVFLFLVGILIQTSNLFDVKLITEYGIIFKGKLITWRKIEYYEWDKGLSFYCFEGQKIMFTEKYEYRTEDLNQLLIEVLPNK